jgi:hypothetical protein
MEAAGSKSGRKCVVMARMQSAGVTARSCWMRRRLNPGATPRNSDTNDCPAVDDGVSSRDTTAYTAVEMAVSSIICRVSCPPARIAQGEFRDEDRNEPNLKL